MLHLIPLVIAIAGATLPPITSEKLFALDVGGQTSFVLATTRGFDQFAAYDLSALDAAVDGACEVWLEGDTSSIHFDQIGPEGFGKPRYLTQALGPRALKVYRSLIAEGDRREYLGLKPGYALHAMSFGLEARRAELQGELFRALDAGDGQASIERRFGPPGVDANLVAAAELAFGRRIDEGELIGMAFAARRVRPRGGLEGYVRDRVRGADVLVGRLDHPEDQTARDVLFQTAEVADLQRALIAIEALTRRKNAMKQVGDRLVNELLVKHELDTYFDRSAIEQGRVRALASHSLASLNPRTTLTALSEAHEVNRHEAWQSYLLERIRRGGAFVVADVVSVVPGADAGVDRSLLEYLDEHGVVVRPVVIPRK